MVRCNDVTELLFFRFSACESLDAKVKEAKRHGVVVMEPASRSKIDRNEAAKRIQRRWRAKHSEAADYLTSTVRLNDVKTHAILQVLSVRP